jgi:hypothetical protein
VANGSPNGYQVQIANPAALPVELLSFSGTASSKSEVTLECTTASEEGNLGFEIQRSGDKDNWKTLSFVEGAGDSSEKTDFAITDRSALNGNYYYRLKQIDFDGQYEFSDVIIVENRTKVISLIIFPNPTTSEISVSIPNEIIPTQGIIYDAAGQQWRVLEFEGNIARENVSGLSPGQYFVSIYTENGIHTTTFQKAK